MVALLYVNETRDFYGFSRACPGCKSGSRVWFPVFAARAPAQRPTSYAVFVSSHPLPFGKTSHPQLNMPLSAAGSFFLTMWREPTPAPFITPLRAVTGARAASCAADLRLRASETGALLRCVPCPYVFSGCGGFRRPVPTAAVPADTALIYMRMRLAAQILQRSSGSKSSIFVMMLLKSASV